MDALTKGADFLLIPVYAKLLSQEELGLYTYLFFIVTTSASIIKLGVDVSLSKLLYEAPSGKARGEMLLSANAVWMSTLLLLILCSYLFNIDRSILVSLLGEHGNYFEQLRPFLFLYSAFVIWQNVLYTYYTVQEKVAKYQKLNFLKVIVCNTTILICLWQMEDINGAILRFKLEAVAAIVVFIPLIYHFVKQFQTPFRKQWILKTLNIGLPMMGSVIVALVFNVSDKYYVQRAEGFERLAIYNMAVLYSTPVALLFNSFHTLWMPKFFRETSAQVNFQKSKAMSAKLFVAYVGLLVALWLLMALLLHFGVISDRYFAVLWIFPIIYGARVFENLTHLFANFFVGWNKTGLSLSIALAMAAITLISNVSLIPMFGIAAAACILLLSGAARFWLTYQQVAIRIKNY